MIRGRVANATYAARGNGIEDAYDLWNVKMIPPELMSDGPASQDASKDGRQKKIQSTWTPLQCSFDSTEPNESRSSIPCVKEEDAGGNSWDMDLDMDIDLDDFVVSDLDGSDDDDDDLDGRDNENRENNSETYDQVSAVPGEQRRYKRWATEEEDQLQYAVAMEEKDKDGVIPWRKIALEYFENKRSANQCRLHYTCVLAPNRKRGDWSTQEDNIILECHGAGMGWYTIAEKLHCRTASQVRDRFIKSLDPDLVRTPWTSEEDRTLVLVQRQVGSNAWSEIAKRLPGRSENDVKNHWYAEVKKKRRAIKRLGC